jgi:hypothetical protein
MTRRQKEPLRSLTDHERTALQKTARSYSEPAVCVLRAKALLHVAQGSSYTQAAAAVGLAGPDPVSRLVRRFNTEGLAALMPHLPPGKAPTYTSVERQRIVEMFATRPDPERDGTATWSIATLTRALHKAPEEQGLSTVCGYTVWKVLVESGYRFVKSRTWCQTGSIKRRTKSQVQQVQDPDTEAKKKSYRAGVHARRTPGTASVV